MKRLRALAIEGGLLVTAVLVAYVLLAPAHVVDGDNAELATIGAIGGRAHPSGYPAYVLYLRLTSWLPGRSPAHTAALATALLGAALVLVLYRACRAWGARPTPSAIAVALYAASPVVLRMHTEAEVFALNGLVVALVLWLAAARGPLKGTWRAVGLGLVAGIGLGNHVTCVLVAPFGVLGVVRGLRESPRSRWLGAAAALGGLVLGLSTYAYLIVADGPASFGRVDGFSDVLDFFLRTDYGGPGAFVPSDVHVSAFANLGALLSTLGRGWLWLPGLLGLGMLGWGTARAGRFESRWAWCALAASWLLAGPILVLRFNIPPVDLGLYVCQRFHLLPLLLLAIPVAAGLDVIGEQLPRAVTASRIWSPGVGAAGAAMVFAALVAAALPWLGGKHSPAMERGVRNILQSLPERAVVVGNSEDLCFGADYVQQAIGTRCDVDVACWIVTSRLWYRQRMAAHGVPIAGAFSLQITPAQAEAILAAGRPLFVDRSQTDVIKALPNYPFGAVIRVLPRGATQPPVAEVVAKNRTLFAAFDLDYPRPHRGDDFAAVAHKRYAATWVTLSAALDAIGDHQGATDAMVLAKSLAPAQD